MLLSTFLFISLRWIDVVDILLVALLIYQLYYLIKGTVAVNIFTGILLFYLLWLIVKALNMSLFGSILGKFIDVGFIALLIVFQQELMVGCILLVYVNRSPHTQPYNAHKEKRREFFFNNKTPAAVDCLLRPSWNALRAVGTARCVVRPRHGGLHHNKCADL